MTDSLSGSSSSSSLGSGALSLAHQFRLRVMAMATTFYKERVGRYPKIEIVDEETGHILKGSNAPPLDKLEAYLEKNQSKKIYVPALSKKELERVLIRYGAKGTNAVLTDSLATSVLSSSEDTSSSSSSSSSRGSAAEAAVLSEAHTSGASPSAAFAINPALVSSRSSSSSSAAAREDVSSSLGRIDVPLNPAPSLPTPAPLGAGNALAVSSAAVPNNPIGEGESSR